MVNGSEPPGGLYLDGFDIPVLCEAWIGDDVFPRVGSLPRNGQILLHLNDKVRCADAPFVVEMQKDLPVPGKAPDTDRKSTRLNSSHSQISYAVFCLKKKKNNP